MPSVYQTRSSVLGARPFARHPGMVAFAVAATGLAVGIKYKSSAMKNNEKAQKDSDSPNYYVSVDRSGGGI